MLKTIVHLYTHCIVFLKKVLKWLSVTRIVSWAISPIEKSIYSLNIENKQSV